MVTIGVAVPCYKGHIQYLPRLLECLASQTRQPDQVVISCSSVDEDAIKRLEQLPQHPFEVLIIPIEGYKNASMNRNIAASVLKTDLISFFDADDLMHPKRLAMIEHAYNTTLCDVVFHNYCSMRDEFPSYEGAELKILDPGTPPRDATQHAHLTIRRQIFEQVKFPEGKIFENMEDTAYARLITSSSLVIAVYLANVLSKYDSSTIYLQGLKGRHVLRREFAI